MGVDPQDTQVITRGIWIILMEIKVYNLKPTNPIRFKPKGSNNDRLYVELFWIWTNPYGQIIDFIQYKNRYVGESEFKILT